MKDVMSAAWPSLRVLLTHRVTYRFLALLLVSLGVVQGGPLVETFGDVVCVLLGGCDG
ncbi:gp19.5 family protein [Pseudomonas weihenstephanensis]|uniref:gp19.5 family protein n=1 Tax=Pseudomonas weihenstephanensis TaxID=1608994 RepID=UPI003B84A9E7